MSWIQTNSGVRFDLLVPSASMVHIGDIAHALSNLCRFNGHVREFYSVAQHSVHVSELVPKQIALAGLLHDASEAYLGDVTTPLKAMLPDYRMIEKNVMRAISRHFALVELMPAAVHYADKVALLTERRDLLTPCEHGWGYPEGIDPDPRTIHPMCPEEAKEAFMDRYYALTEDQP